MARAVFEGLIIDEAGNAVTVTYVGTEPHYVVDDGGFLRHIPARQVDRAVLNAMQESVMENREIVVQGMLEYLGQEDLFTKAAVEASISQMDENIEELSQVGLPQEARAWLGMMGFFVVVDVHGEVTDIHMPEAAEPDM